MPLSRVLPRSVSPGTLHAGGTLNTAQQHWRQGQYGEQLEKGAAVAVERGKEISSKSWNFMKGVYATMATQVEHVARDNGYKVDLGEHWHRLCNSVVRCMHCMPLCWPAWDRPGQDQPDRPCGPSLCTLSEVLVSAGWPWLIEAAAGGQGDR